MANSEENDGHSPGAQILMESNTHAAARRSTGSRHEGGVRTDSSSTKKPKQVRAKSIAKIPIPQAQEVAQDRSSFVAANQPKTGQDASQLSEQADQPKAKTNRPRPKNNFCPVEDCPWKKRGFRDRFDLRKHIEVVHKVPHEKAKQLAMDGNRGTSKSEEVEEAEEEIITDNNFDIRVDHSIWPETKVLPTIARPRTHEIFRMDVVRNLHLRPGKDVKMLDRRIENLESTLVQQRGLCFKGKHACHHCQEQSGPFQECVVIRGYLLEACANCYYNCNGGRCSFRQNQQSPQPTDFSGSTSEPVSVPMPSAPITTSQSGDRAVVAESSETDNFTPDDWIRIYQGLTEEARLQEEATLHMRLSCLATARMEVLGKRKRVSEENLRLPAINYRTPSA
ncbi:hypothetical protein B0O99DRAFT_606644 [Bisporella sp. PMI_857]|nr:hypothetical protein B0O99DRAFT_606644 [Bisporella sp. PMI_857]